MNRDRRKSREEENGGWEEVGQNSLGMQNIVRG